MRQPTLGNLVAVAQSSLPATGSEAWRESLEVTGQKSFRFSCEAGSLSARREAKAERGYWYAYRKSGGRLHKAYLGRTEDLTRERLETVAAQLAQRAAPARAAPVEEARPQPRLPQPSNELIGRARELATVVDLLLSDSTRLLTLTGPRWYRQDAPGHRGRRRTFVAFRRRRLVCRPVDDRRLGTGRA